MYTSIYFPTLPTQSHLGVRPAFDFTELHHSIILLFSFFLSITVKVVGRLGFEPRKALRRQIKSLVSLATRSTTQFGWCGGPRTRDLGIKSPLLCQLSYTPPDYVHNMRITGGCSRARTCDQIVKSDLLYQTELYTLMPYCRHASRYHLRAGWCDTMSRSSLRPIWPFAYYQRRKDVLSVLLFLHNVS